ncbi:MAG: hypothetical protein F6J92_29480 [Symploca sp. SIO1A3]|nr:hypothetical protein [Symploca sp. SIO1A3]
MTDNPVGFPKGMLLVQGATPEQAERITEAFKVGDTLPLTGKRKLDKTIEQLYRHPQYGKG